MTDVAARRERDPTFVRQLFPGYRQGRHPAEQIPRAELGGPRLPGLVRPEDPGPLLHCRAALRSGGRAAAAAADSTVRRPGAGLCNLCHSAREANDVLLFAAPRAGAAGRQGNTVGTYICADLDCSLYARGLLAADAARTASARSAGPKGWERLGLFVDRVPGPVGGAGITVRTRRWMARYGRDCRAVTQNVMSVGGRRGPSMKRAPGPAGTTPHGRRRRRGEGG